ncbi:MAG: hypothetical protein M1839_006756 [Geoglossum umbratile]|nr:MAG: hypothetical protein M1839_006756 [Geoglossum umbratile]
MSYPATVEGVLTILRRMEAKMDTQDKRVEDIEKALGVGGRVEAKFDALVKRAEDTEKSLGVRGMIGAKVKDIEKKLGVLDGWASDIEKMLGLVGREMGKFDRRSSAAAKSSDRITLLVDGVPAEEVSSKQMMRAVLGMR